MQKIIVILFLLLILKTDIGSSYGIGNHGGMHDESHSVNYHEEPSKTNDNTFSSSTRTWIPEIYFLILSNDEDHTTIKQHGQWSNLIISSNCSSNASIYIQELNLTIIVNANLTAKIDLAGQNCSQDGYQNLTLISYIPLPKDKNDSSCTVHIMHNVVLCGDSGQLNSGIILICIISGIIMFVIFFAILFLFFSYRRTYPTDYHSYP
ncbi:MAG: hypothetical protein Satyrvirus2_7 [Satyrvirus sp.]|uniref:Uncharacterized protein n=1 Tax=Satyrvirus sp. TaxID=2487771 RepID=A0A3G5ACR2_9VIRU|nr:MAG: hypothetical protein Satyrvirus2_7 [Satyrvirus sp.]